MLEEPANDAPAENYLLVGSDSREGDRPERPQRRSDRRRRRRSSTGAATRSWSCAASTTAAPSLLSLPRDLWVPIAGTGDPGKINSAYNEGPQPARRRPSPRRSASRSTTTSRSTSPGSKQLVDAIGGVEICVARRPRTPTPGCARSRLHQPRRLAGPGLRPQPPLRGVRSTATGMEDPAPTSAASSASSSSSAARVDKLLTRGREQPVRRSADLLGGGDGRGARSTQSLDPLKAADALREAADGRAADLHAAGRGRDERATRARSSCSTEAAADPRLLPRADRAGHRRRRTTVDG